MIYVIGKNGYIGSNVVKYLIEKGLDVYGCGHEDVAGLNREGKINPNRDDTIINCAAKGIKPDKTNEYVMTIYNALMPMHWYRTYSSGNFTSTAKFIQICSSSEIFQPYTAYARTKSLASDYLRGKATLCYIYTAYGGIKQHEHMFMTQLLKAKKEGTMFRVETPYATRDFIHIKRICEGIEKLIHEPIQEVHFGHGKARRMFSVAKKVMGYKYEWSGGAPDQPEWQTANPYFPDTFEEDLRLETDAQ